MSDFTIQQLFTAPTQDQFRAQMVTALMTMGIPADKWRAGGVASTILTVASMAMAQMAVIVATIIQGFFLPTSTGGSLKLLAQFVYGVIVPQATFATGNVTLTNSGGGVYNIAAGQYTALNSRTKVTYTNVNAFTLGALTSVTIAMTATVQGTPGNANPGDINTNVTSLLGVTPSNAAALIGIDAPTDAAIRLLCTNSLGVRSVRGVRSAYAFAVQTATNIVTGAPVNINRWAIVADSHVGTVNVFVASPSGAADPNDVLGVAANIELVARPEAVVVITTSASTSNYSPTITVWVTLPTGTSAVDAQTAAANALTSYIANYPIGGAIAADDTFSNLQGLFASGVVGAIANGIKSINGSVISVQGAIDAHLPSGVVAVDAATINIRVVTPIAGTFS